MGIDTDATGLASEDDAHRGNAPKPGMYHVLIAEVNDTFDKFDKVIVEFIILAGTVPGQEGLKLTEFFATTEKAMPRLVTLAIATGLLQPGERREVEFTDAIDREIIIKVDERKGQDGKVYTNITWDGMWSLNHPTVAEVPRADATQLFDKEATAGEAVADAQPEEEDGFDI